MASKLGKSIFVACFATLSGSTRYTTLIFDVSGYPKSSLWYRAIAAEAHRSRLNPSNTAKIYGIKKVIEHLSDDSRELLKQCQTDFTRESFQQLLREMDLELGSVETWSPSNRFENASRWRGFLVRSSGRLGDGTPIANALNGYHTPLKDLSSRHPISFKQRLFGRTFSNGLISTIEHESPDELRRRAREEVRERLDAIATACISELKLYEKVCEYQQECLAIDVPESARNHILGIIEGKRSVGTHRNKRWYGYDPRWVVSVALGYIDAKKFGKITSDGVYERLYLPTSRTLPGLFEFDHYQFAS